MVSKMRTFIIAEAGVNHNGSEELALGLIEIAAKAGVDAVKFQSFKAEKLISKGVKKAKYQQKATGAGDQYSMLKELELSDGMHRLLIKRCNELGIEFMSTPFDAESADFLVELGMLRIKVPSGEITNHPLLEHLAQKNLPIILSTGMSTIDEVRDAVIVIERTRNSHGFCKPLSEMLTLLHCTSNYPAELKSLNLRAMPTMAEALSLPVGYSDHTMGILIPLVAVSMGAVVIEKHITLDRGMPGPDHAASIEPEELSDMVKRIRDIEIAMGCSEKRPSSSESEIRLLARRSVTLIRDMLGGQRIQREDVEILRPGDGIQPKDINLVVGRRVKSAMKSGSTLKWAHLQHE